MISRAYNVSLRYVKPAHGMICAVEYALKRRGGRNADGHESRILQIDIGGKLNVLADICVTAVYRIPENFQIVGVCYQIRRVFGTVARKRHRSNFYKRHNKRAKPHKHKQRAKNDNAYSLSL